MHENFARPEKNIAHLGLKEGDHVADLGAGPGHYALACAEVVGETGRVTTVEIQKELVKKVETAAHESGFENVDVIWADLEKEKSTKLKADSVDAVILSNVLFQIKDKSALFREAKRILKPRAKVLLIDWQDSHGGLGPHIDHIVNQKKAEKLARDAGFAVSQVVTSGNHHYGIILTSNV